jgi:hypothetical protein
LGSGTVELHAGQREQAPRVAANALFPERVDRQHAAAFALVADLRDLLFEPQRVAEVDAALLAGFDLDEETEVVA